MTTPKNRFAGIVDKSRAQQAETTEPESTAPVAEQETPPAPVERAAVANITKLNIKTQPAKRVSKSSNPEYRQISAYLRRETHQAAHRRLLDEGSERDLSDVIETLLSAWLKK